jgi:hypothetical protein
MVYKEEPVREESVFNKIITLYVDSKMGLAAGMYVILLREHLGKKKFICTFVKV